MNKKNIVTQKNIMKVADFLEDSIKWLKENDMGCCRFKLSSDLALYIGWSGGWDPKDDSVIHSTENPDYAIDAAVKIRNDDDWSDFEYLNFPWYEDDGECWNSSIAPSPKYKRRDFRQDAKWFLETFVGITNAYKRGELSYE